MRLGEGVEERVEGAEAGSQSVPAEARWSSEDRESVPNGLLLGDRSRISPLCRSPCVKGSEIHSQMGPIVICYFPLMMQG